MIHQIYSTLPTFKNLDFNPGLNLLLAEKSAGATSKQTRNRAGKTSLIELVHFLTGADAGPGSLLRTKALADFTFGMNFDLSGSETTVERSGATKSRVQVAGPEFLNGETRVSNTEWTSILGEKMFGLHSLEGDQGESPTFRSLFAYFVRRQLSGAYTTPEKQATMQQCGDFQMALMFLMGLDWQIAGDWQVVRNREGTLDELKKAAAEGAFGSIIGKAADLRTQLTVAEARLKKLRDEVGQFRVLPQYGAMEAEASMLTRQLNDLANANTIDLSTIRDLELAVELEEAPALADLNSIYSEAGVVLPGLIQKRYEDVRSFHESVIRNRRDYLAGEIEASKSNIEERNRQKAGLDERRAEIMGVLRSHGALDQFTALQGEAGRLESEVESLRQRFEAAEKLEGTKNELEIERNRLTLRLRRDFAERKERVSEAIIAFEETSKSLYESAGSMQIEVTSNGPVFRFPMQGSRSKGIKSMQIYCFDMMLMRLARDAAPVPVSWCMTAICSTAWMAAK